MHGVEKSNVLCLGSGECNLSLELALPHEWTTSVLDDEDGVRIYQSWFHPMPFVIATGKICIKVHVHMWLAWVKNESSSLSAN